MMTQNHGISVFVASLCLPLIAAIGAKADVEMGQGNSRMDQVKCVEDSL